MAEESNSVSASRTVGSLVSIKNSGLKNVLGNATAAKNGIK